MREETFVTEAEAQLSDFKDPVSGVPLKKMEEASYFFRMSKYQARLVEHIKASPHFILPESRRNSILCEQQPTRACHAASPSPPDHDTRINQPLRQRGWRRS